MMFLASKSLNTRSILAAPPTKNNGKNIQITAILTPMTVNKIRQVLFPTTSILLKPEVHKSFRATYSSIFIFGPMNEWVHLRC